MAGLVEDGNEWSCEQMLRTHLQTWESTFRKGHAPSFWKAGTLCKMLESGIFGTLFLKMSVVRFLELIAKIGIGIAKIGIPIGMDH
jgi:hypothetical protein